MGFFFEFEVWLYAIKKRAVSPSCQGSDYYLGGVHENRFIFVYVSMQHAVTIIVSLYERRTFLLSARTTGPRTNNERLLVQENVRRLVRVRVLNLSDFRS